jgi:hypothetical protein
MLLPVVAFAPCAPSSERLKIWAGSLQQVPSTGSFVTRQPGPPRSFPTARGSHHGVSGTSARGSAPSSGWGSSSPRFRAHAPTTTTPGTMSNHNTQAEHTDSHDQDAAAFAGLEPDSLAPEIKLAMEQASAEHEVFTARILAEAAAGTGVQPWDREWPLGDFDLHEHLAVDWNADPALLGQLITIANWALRSPQGRKALLQDGQPANPWQHTLDTVRELRDALTYRQRDLLDRRANDEDWMHNWPLGQFDLYEHMVTDKHFKPDWFTTGELIEMADWALNAPEATEMSWTEETRIPRHAAELKVLGIFREALLVRRQRLLLAQGRQLLPADSAARKELEQRFSATYGGSAA